MAKVKVRVVERYNDMVLKKIQEVGTEFEVDEQRAKKLVEHKKAVILDDQKPTKKANEKEG